MSNLRESQINWETLARQVGAINEHGEQVSSMLARQALVEILGEREIRTAVETYVNDKLGKELARSVLWMLQPHVAAKHCLEIYRHDDDIERRRAAVELFRVAADASFLSYVTEFFNDADSHIQVWGAGYLDQLLWASGDAEASEETESILQIGEAHPNECVRETIQRIRETLAGRKARIDADENKI